MKESSVISLSKGPNEEDGGTGGVGLLGGGTGFLLTHLGEHAIDDTKAIPESVFVVFQMVSN